MFSRYQSFMNTANPSWIHSSCSFVRILLELLRWINCSESCACNLKCLDPACLFVCLWFWFGLKRTGTYMAVQLFFFSWHWSLGIGNQCALVITKAYRIHCSSIININRLIGSSCHLFSLIFIDLIFYRSFTTWMFYEVPDFTAASEKSVEKNPQTSMVQVSTQ